MSKPFMDSRLAIADLDGRNQDSILKAWLGLCAFGLAAFALLIIWGVCNIDWKVPMRDIKARNHISPKQGGVFKDGSELVLFTSDKKFLPTESLNK